MVKLCRVERSRANTLAASLWLSQVQCASPPSSDTLGVSKQSCPQLYLLCVLSHLPHSGPSFCPYGVSKLLPTSTLVVSFLFLRNNFSWAFFFLAFCCCHPQTFSCCGRQLESNFIKLYNLGL